MQQLRRIWAPLLRIVNKSHAPVNLLLRKGTKYHSVYLPICGVLGFSLLCSKNVAHLDLGEYSFFPQYKTKEDTFHWLKYYYQHNDLTLIEEAITIIFQNFNQLSTTQGEEEMLEGMLIALFKNNEDIVGYWVEKLEPHLETPNEKLLLYRALRESGSKFGQEYLQKIKDGENAEEIEEILKLPILDLRSEDPVSYKDIVSYLQILRGMFAITKGERIVQHVTEIAAAWKTDTLTKELNLEKFYVAMKARNLLVQMNYEHDCLHDMLVGYSVLLDDQTREALHL